MYFCPKKLYKFATIQTRNMHSIIVYKKINRLCHKIYSTFWNQQSIVGMPCGHMSNSWLESEFIGQAFSNTTWQNKPIRHQKTVGYKLALPTVNCGTRHKQSTGRHGCAGSDHAFERSPNSQLQPASQKSCLWHHSRTEHGKTNCTGQYSHKNKFINSSSTQKHKYKLFFGLRYQLRWNILSLHNNNSLMLQ